MACGVTRLLGVAAAGMSLAIATLVGCEEKKPVGSAAAPSASTPAAPKGAEKGGVAPATNGKSEKAESSPPPSLPSGKGSEGSTAKGGRRIAVVPKGTAHEFWKSVQAGTIRAGKEAGVEVSFTGPAREDDREQQIALVQNLISGKASAIVLAPLDDKALVEPVRQAKAAGIPVVIFDSPLQGESGKDFVTLVATDNFKGGEIAGEALAKAMGGKGKALLLRYNEGSASTTQREEGFVQAAKKAGLEVVDPKRYAGVTRASAQEAAENLLAANGDISGVFCPNESSAFGMLLALRSRGMAGKVKFVGFDSSDAVVDAMKKGELAGLVLQNPIRMGYLGVKAALDALDGKKVETRIDTGAMLVTPENMEKPEVIELLRPNFKELLGG